jgi:D-glycero-alpha-D-manno-heptose 1-phosphate guanylyltransferase
MIDTALILAGGFGTRLRSVVEGVPKPLAPVGETPFLHYCLEQLIRHGINKFIFSLHYQAKMIVDYIKV